MNIQHTATTTIQNGTDFGSFEKWAKGMSGIPKKAKVSFTYTAPWSDQRDGSSAPGSLTIKWTWTDDDADKPQGPVYR